MTALFRLATANLITEEALSGSLFPQTLMEIKVTCLWGGKEAVRCISGVHPHHLDIAPRSSKTKVFHALFVPFEAGAGRSLHMRRQEPPI